MIRTASCLVLAAVLPAQGGGLQLLDNPGGESPVAIRVGQADGSAQFDLPGWESESGDWVAQGAPWSKVEAVGGAAFLRPRSGDRAVLRQTVPIAAGGGAPRPRFLIAGCWLRTMAGKDAAELRVLVQDAALGELATASSGERRDRAWTWQEVVVAVPADAVHATVELHGVRNDGRFADAFFDELVLEPFGPGLPTEFAKTPARELQERLASAEDPGLRRALCRALAVDPRGAAALAARHAAAVDDPVFRRHLLTLLALGGSRAAQAPLEAALGAADPAERGHALALLPFAGVDASKVVAPLAEAADPKVRADALAALAAAGDAKTLARVARGDPVRAVEVIRAIRGVGAGLGPFYRPVLAPWLGADADARARDEAMRTLGAARDPRFVRHLTQLAASAGSAGVLAAWFRLAGAFGTAEAFAAVSGAVDAAVPHAAEALLASAAALASPAGLDWARRAGLRADSPIQRLAAVRILRAAADEADLAAFRAAAADADPLVALEAVAALGARSGAEATELLETLYLRAPGPVAAAALRALCDRGAGAAEAVERAVAAAAGHAAWEARAAGLDLLRGEAAAGAFGVLAEAFEDPVWQVRAAAFRAAATVREKRAVAALVARAPAERGAALGFLCDALIELTGVDQGDDAAAWGRWWGIVAAGFEVPAKPKAGARDLEARARTTASYYGIPIRGDKLVFVIDLSGSMAAEVDGKTRLAAAKEKLIEVLRQLRPAQSFGILAFGTEVGFWEKELVAATPDRVEAAAKWVDRLTLRGATNIYDSLELALSFTGVETVFLLSDGGPSAGKFTDMDEIRSAVRLQNRELSVRINTILIGGSAREQAFMKRLAAENHGEVGTAEDRRTR
jgi:Mg-chelatase subunit ChlD